MRLLAIGKVATSQSGKWSSEPAEANFTFRRLVEEPVGHEAETQSSSRASQKYLLRK